MHIFRGFKVFRCFQLNVCIHRVQLLHKVFILSIYDILLPFWENLGFWFKVTLFWQLGYVGVYAIYFEFGCGGIVGSFLEVLINLNRVEMLSQLSWGLHGITLPSWSYYLYCTSRSQHLKIVPGLVRPFISLVWRQWFIEVRLDLVLA